MAYMHIILGETRKQDYIFTKKYGKVRYHEDSTVHKLKDIGNCMIITACDKEITFEKEFLVGTGLSATDFEMHYVYHAEYLYIPKDGQAFANAIPRIMDNTRVSSWCINVMFHINENLYMSTD